MNARCAVFAAANPVYGQVCASLHPYIYISVFFYSFYFSTYLSACQYILQIIYLSMYICLSLSLFSFQYDNTRSVQFNVSLPDSLLSRFDLLFIMLDIPSPERLAYLVCAFILYVVCYSLFTFPTNAEIGSCLGMFCASTPGWAALLVVCY